jgi:hypothetical protein
MKSIVSVLLFVVMVSSASVASAQAPQQGGVAVRESDSLLNGALIGAGAGVASVLFICTRMEPLRNCADDFGTLAAFGALGAGIGIGVDALVRKTVYRTASGATELHAAPIIGRRAKGLRLSVVF